MVIPRLKRIGYLYLLACILSCSHSTDVGGGGTPAPGGGTPGGSGIPADAGQGQFGFVINGKSVLRKNHVATTVGIASVQRHEGPGIPPHELMLTIDLEMEHAVGDPTPRGLNFYVLFTKAVPATFLAPVADSQRNTIGTFTLQEYFDTASQTKEQLPGAVLTLTKFDTVNNLVSGTYHYLSQLPGGVGPVDTVTSGYFNDVPIGTGGYSPGTITATHGARTFTSTDTGYNNPAGWIIAGSTVLGFTGWATGPIGTQYISLQIVDPAIGTFPLGIPASGTTAIYAESDYSGAGVSTNTENGGSGAITVTKYDVVTHRISGSFEFTGSDQYSNPVVVSNGTFSNVFIAVY